MTNSSELLYNLYSIGVGVRIPILEKATLKEVLDYANRHNKRWAPMIRVPVNDQGEDIDGSDKVEILFHGHWIKVTR